jgi:cytochrome c5
MLRSSVLPDWRAFRNGNSLEAPYNPGMRALTKSILWIGAVVAMTAAGLIALPAAQDEPGERLVNRSCTNCHDLRRIQVQALDRDAWTIKVNAMIEKGAVVGKDDLPALLDYLVGQHGPVPDGPGKEILLNTCTRCHDLKRIKEHGGNRQQWEETLQAMLNEGAPLSDEEFAVILAYLARNFRNPIR